MRVGRWRANASAMPPTTNEIGYGIADVSPPRSATITAEEGDEDERFGHRYRSRSARRCA